MDYCLKLNGPWHGHPGPRRRSKLCSGERSVPQGQHSYQHLPVPDCAPLRCLFLQLLICIFPRMGCTNAAGPLHLAWSCGPLLPLLNRHHGLVPPADEIGISVAWLALRTSRLATAPPKPLQTDRGLRQIVAPRFIWAWMAEEWQLSCWAGVPWRWPMWA